MAEVKKIATRDSYGNTLKELARTVTSTAALPRAT